MFRNESFLKPLFSMPFKFISKLVIGFVSTILYVFWSCNIYFILFVLEYFSLSKATVTLPLSVLVKMMFWLFLQNLVVECLRDRRVFSILFLLVFLWISRWKKGMIVLRIFVFSVIVNVAVIILDIFNELMNSYLFTVVYR